VLQAMAHELRHRGVTRVVMEASGVYTEPVYYGLCEQDFEQVAVINPAHAKALRGHRTARDCVRPAELFECSRMDGVPERPDMHRVRHFVGAAHDPTLGGFRATPRPGIVTLRDWCSRA